MIKIIPAILTNSLEEFERIIRLLEPHTERVHLDIADGVFVPNETIKGHSELELIETRLKFDVHLMVNDPIGEIALWDNKGIADRFIVHVEFDNIEEAVGLLKADGKKVGLALNPDTQIFEAERFIKTVDFVQFMTVNPGYQGRDFLEHVLEKIKSFHKEYPEMVISVDGGINFTTAKKAIQAGATELVSGSYIIKSGNVEKAITELKNINSKL